MRDSELARYQTALLTVLTREGLATAERVKLLREHEAMAPYASYVEAFDPELVALGAAIAGKWAKPARGKRGLGALRPSMFLSRR